MTTLRFHDELLLLDPLGALVWPARQALVVADLHLEKGTAAALRGQLVPPLDTRLTLDRLALLMRRHRPRTVVALGDTFHDASAPARMAPRDADHLRDMARAAAFVWVHGNHDPAAPNLPGESAQAWTAGPLTFRHQAALDAVGEVCGHHHPKASVDTRAGRGTRPCVVHDPARIMLPAMGAYTGGLDVRHPAIARLFPRGGRLALLGRDRLFSFAMGPGFAPPLDNAPTA